MILEAVRAARCTCLEHDCHVDGTPASNSELRPLPPRLSAAMSIVISSAIQSILTAAQKGQPLVPMSPNGGCNGLMR
jgi:hypothetical protein